MKNFIIENGKRVPEKQIDFIPFTGRCNIIRTITSGKPAHRDIKLADKSKPEEWELV